MWGDNSVSRACGFGLWQAAARSQPELMGSSGFRMHLATGTQEHGFVPVTAAAAAGGIGAQWLTGCFA